mmetsp:Transcript_82938/g.231325  ORF Transcript_82938/g.231325 Transcript_82938/m.231325 type:complete len:316 (+) Transcript_82938:312-1259(+)
MPVASDPRALVDVSVGVHHLAMPLGFPFHEMADVMTAVRQLDLLLRRCRKAIAPFRVSGRSAIRWQAVAARNFRRGGVVGHRARNLFSGHVAYKLLASVLRPSVAIVTVPGVARLGGSGDCGEGTSGCNPRPRRHGAHVGLQALVLPGSAAHLAESGLLQESASTRAALRSESRRRGGTALVGAACGPSIVTAATVRRNRLIANRLGRARDVHSIVVPSCPVAELLALQGFLQTPTFDQVHESQVAGSTASAAKDAAETLGEVQTSHRRRPLIAEPVEVPITGALHVSLRLTAFLVLSNRSRNLWAFGTAAGSYA